VDRPHTGDRDGERVFVEYLCQSRAGLSKPGLEGLSRTRIVNARTGRSRRDRSRWPRCRATCISRRCASPRSTRRSASAKRAEAAADGGKGAADGLQRGVLGCGTRAMFVLALDGQKASGAVRARRTRSTACTAGIVDGDKADAVNRTG
jgi:hypothetical protein